MAKQKITHTPIGGMTVMVFKLEGEDTTLQAALRTISDAIMATVPSNPRAAGFAGTAAIAGRSSALRRDGNGSFSGHALR